MGLTCSVPLDNAIVTIVILLILWEGTIPCCVLMISSQILLLFFLSHGSLPTYLPTDTYLPAILPVQLYIISTVCLQWSDAYLL